MTEMTTETQEQDDSKIGSPAELIEIMFYPDGKPADGFEMTAKQVKKIHDKLEKALTGPEFAYWQSEIAKILEHHKRHYAWKVSSFNKVQIAAKAERSLLNESAFMLADVYEGMLSSALTVLSQYGTTSPEISQQVLVGAFSVMIADETGCFDSKTIVDILRADTFVRAGNVLFEQKLYKNTGIVFSPGLLLLKKRLIATGVQQIPDVEKAVTAFLRYAKLTHLAGLSLKQLEKIYQQREMNLISPLFAAEQVRKACTPLHIEHLLRICTKKPLRLVATVQNEQPAPITDKAFTAEAKGFVTRRNAVQALSHELKEHTAKSKKRYHSLKQWLTTYQSEQEVDELSGSLLSFIVELAHDKVTPAYASSTLSRYLSALNPLIEIFEYRNFSELDTDALAKGFQQLLNRTTSNVTQAILPRFISSIRHLIPDAARVLAQLDMSADQMEADARILGPCEGSELIRKLLHSDHRWDLENGLILALGFYCGLRRGEVLGLRLMDIEGAAFPYLRVKSNQHRKLKSSHSNRTLAIKSLLPDDVLEALLQLKQDRSLESRGNLQRRLFHPRSKKVTQADDERMVEINSLLKEQTGDPGFSFHNLRHSFANWLLLRLLIAVEPGIKTPLENALPLDESFNPSACRQLFRDQLNNDPTYGSRFILHHVSQQLGHSSPAVTLKSYIHILPLIEYAMKSVKRQETYQRWAEALLFKPAGKHGYNLQERFSKQPKGFAYALEQHCWHHLQETVTLEQTEDLPAFEPPPALTLRSKLKPVPLSLQLLPVVLSRLFVEKMSLQQVAAQMNLAVHDLQRLKIICDEILAVRIRSNRPRAKFPTLLSRVIGKVEQQFFDRLIRKMSSVNFDWRLAKAAKAILRLQPNRNLIPFDNQDALTEFIKLLGALDIPIESQGIRIDLDKQEEVFRYITETSLFAQKQNILPASLLTKSQSHEVVISKANPLVSQLRHQGAPVNTKPLDIPYKGSGKRVYLKPINPDLPEVASPALKNTLMVCYIWWRYQ